MFDMAEFLKTNLINGYWDGSFSEAQVNLFAFSYLNKAFITQEDFDYIMESIKPPEEQEYPEDDEIEEPQPE